MKFTRLSIAALLLLAGCGTAPSAPVTAQAPAAAGVEALALKTPKAKVTAKEGVLALTLEHQPMFKTKERFDQVCVKTAMGGIFSSVWLGQEGRVWVKTDNPLDPKEPAKWWAIAHYERLDAKLGAVITLTMRNGAKFTYRKATTSFPTGKTTPAALDLDLGQVTSVPDEPSFVAAE